MGDGRGRCVIARRRPSAQFQLANMYELGTGVEQNLQKSIGWYKKADQFGYYLAKAKVETSASASARKKFLNFIINGFKKK